MRRTCAAALGLAALLSGCGPSDTPAATAPTVADRRAAPAPAVTAQGGTAAAAAAAAMAIDWQRDDRDEAAEGRRRDADPYRIGDSLAGADAALPSADQAAGDTAAMPATDDPASTG